MQVNVFEAKNRLSQLIKVAQSGEDIVIANRGKPVARLVGVHEKAHDMIGAGSARRVLDWLASHPLPAYGRRPGAAIDAAIEEERASWD